ncbi:MAG: sodium/proline symporter [Synergistaceae bacterium]|nr:sodium/proline symporter [Synergistaceae bacterium]
MDTNMTLRVSIIIAFFALTLGIGFYAQYGKNKIKDEEDMNLGGRKLGWFTTGASAAASGCSAFAFVGMAGLAYNAGISMIWYSLLATTWSWLIFFVLGKRLRNFSTTTNSVTVIDYISERFEDKSGILRTISATIVVIFMVGYIASNYSAMGKTFVGFLKWDLKWSIIIGAVIVTIYTCMAGFRALVWIDTLLALVMLLGSGGFLAFVIAKSGSLSNLLEQVAAIDPMLVDITGGRTGLVFATFLIGWVGSGLMGIGNPHIVVRPMGISDTNQLKAAGIWSFIINVWVMYMGVFSGLAARIWFPNLADVDLAYSVIVGEIMGPLLGGIIIAGILSATMSTVAAQLLVAATEISRNVLKKSQTATEKQRINFTRICVVIVTIIGCWFAFNSSQIVFWMILFAWGGLGSAFGPVILLSLYWKRMTWAGALAGVLVGAITVVIWNQTPALKAMVYEGVPGMVLSTLAIYVVSMVSVPPKSAQKLFEK